MREQDRLRYAAEREKAQEECQEATTNRAEPNVLVEEDAALK